MDKKEIKLKEKEIIGWLGDSYKETYVNIIDIFLMVFEKMSAEQKQLLISDIGMDLDITEEVVSRLSGDRVGWSRGDDNKYRLEALARVESESITNLSWKILSELIHKVDTEIDKLKSNYSLYFKMYHDPQHGEFFKKWLKDNDIKNEYQQEKQDIKGFIQESINKFLDSYQDD